MQKLNGSYKTRGFTIVELLIVIVVIGILAAITLVAYNGIQNRATDSARSSDVAQIRKALEAYRAVHDRYPPHTASGTNVPAGFSGVWGTYYSYSVATNDSWLRTLVQSGFLDKAPLDPVNDNSHYYVYYSSTSIGACTEPVYVLAVVGYSSSANIPADSRTLNCTGNGTTANWMTASNRAVFSNLRTP